MCTVWYDSYDQGVLACRTGSYSSGSCLFPFPICTHAVDNAHHRQQLDQGPRRGQVVALESLLTVVTGLLIFLNIPRFFTVLEKVPVGATNMAAAVNRSFASPAANADYPVALQDVAGGFLARVYSGFSGPSLVLTVLLLLVAYDQCALPWLERTSKHH